MKQLRPKVSAVPSEGGRLPEFVKPPKLYSKTDPRIPNDPVVNYNK